MSDVSHWSDDALCIGMHSELWYPPPFKEERTATEAQYYNIGKLVCEHCPVSKECDEAGESEEYGMWGGRTPKDRRLGRTVPTKTYLPLKSIDVIPSSAPDVRLDIPSLTLELKQHLKRRPRKPRKS